MSITTIYNLQLNIIQTKWKLFTKDNLKFQAWLSLAEEVDRETLKVSKLKKIICVLCFEIFRKLKTCQGQIV
jgi:hypothetical protein